VKAHITKQGIKTTNITNMDECGVQEGDTRANRVFRTANEEGL